MSGDNDELQRVDVMALSELRIYWRKLHGFEAPTTMSKELLRLAICYKLQEQKFGGLSRRSQLRIEVLESRKPGEMSVRNKDQRQSLKPGAKLLRSWQGKIHEVLALEQGQFAFDGKAYRSLTEIAREITGAHWSGPRFFGLKTKAGSKNGVHIDG